MFENLTEQLQRSFKNIQGLGKISEENVSEALRDVRMALLDADVNLQVAKDFIEKVKAKSLGKDVLLAVSPGQQIVKIVFDELTTLLGSEHAGISTQADPTRIMMVGLHGSGKTTTSGKLAAMFLKKGKKPLLVACDVYRPAAMDQLKTLGTQLNVPVFMMMGELDVLKIARQAEDYAIAQRADVIIYDTAGRLQIDEPLVQELVKLRTQTKPHEILLIADGALGQEAVNVAAHFDKSLGLTGIILTKLDGDARGGAALSMRSVTGKPIKFMGVGEKLDALEPFHPERIASRILGMGDIVTLVEKAQETVDVDQALALEKKLKKGDLDLNDLLDQLRAMKKLGPLENILGMLPGMGNMANLASDPKVVNEGQKQLKSTEAIILSMTTGERRYPHLINAKRRQRIARGSGTTVQGVNQLLNQFEQMRKLMKNQGKLKQMMAAFSGKGMPGGFQGFPGRR